ncbi:hypothetical protein [Paenibacillus yanchengensis]
MIEQFQVGLMNASVTFSEKCFRYFTYNYKTCGNMSSEKQLEI